MEEQLISFETTKLAKEKGFNIKIYEDTINYELNPPTQSLLQKWLREEHDIHIELFVTSYGNWMIRNLVLISKVVDIDPLDDTIYDTYENALEVGLQKALEII